MLHLFLFPFKWTFTVKTKQLTSTCVYYKKTYRLDDTEQAFLQLNQLVQVAANQLTVAKYQLFLIEKHKSYQKDSQTAVGTPKTAYLAP